MFGLYYSYHSNHPETSPCYARGKKTPPGGCQRAARTACFGLHAVRASSGCNPACPPLVAEDASTVFPRGCLCVEDRLDAGRHLRRARCTVSVRPCPWGGVRTSPFLVGHVWPPFFGPRGKSAHRRECGPENRNALSGAGSTTGQGRLSCSRENLSSSLYVSYHLNEPSN